MSSIAYRPAPGFTIPLRKESYTTWLYLAFAATVVVLTAFGLWYAGMPTVGP